MRTISILSLVLALSVFIYFRNVKSASEPQPGVLAAVWDTSGSVAFGCEGLVGRVRERLADPDFRAKEFVLITTGGSKSSFEGELAARLQIPKRNRNLLVKSGDSSTEFLERVSQACRNAMSARPEGSAVHRAVENAVEYLKASGCAQRQCELIIGSDGLDNANPAVGNFLFGSHDDPPAELILDNGTAIRTVWCGFAQIGPGGPRDSAQRLVKRWSSLLKTPFIAEPYCAASEP